MRMESENPDVIIDGQGWILDSIGEMELVVSRALREFKGIEIPDERATWIRLWSIMDDSSQKKFERSKRGKQLSINFDRIRGSGAE